MKFPSLAMHAWGCWDAFVFLWAGPDVRGASRAFLFRFLVGKDVTCEDLIERGGFIL